jgi:hypothetical protein
VSPTEITVPVRLMNKHRRAEQLPADGLFTLRDATTGKDTTPASVEGLGGKVASNGTATGTVVFRPAVPVAQPVLFFHGGPLDANSAYVALG